MCANSSSRWRTRRRRPAQITSFELTSQKASLPISEPKTVNGLECYVSVDVETAGPNPSHYSLLSIGACLVIDPAREFYVELQPVNDLSTDEALSISQLSLEDLAEQGLPPAEAMTRFADWLAGEVPPDQQPVFVAFNAPFDWMFVSDYFHRFLGRNPFGHAALDLKALYMGRTNVPWSQTTMRYVAKRYLDGRPLTHNALQDAKDQAELMQRILAEPTVP
ncbi:MAG: 3'-5' exonuclease [Anaerolineales bacterium]|nr:MAG: 3'-5' exonuclease [Anaerolineales bacterium]